ncbi:hypothetical protein [Bernardetia sp.]|uniref:hypothetical protein n=1 Tax=Bernardetia sp. TaxID=1937974 RepID=UPI0025BD2027|nr:hypothetical protein [Bernardetia sp.]
MLQRLDPAKMTKEEIFEVIISNPSRAHFLLMKTEEMSKKYDEAIKEYELPDCPTRKDFLQQNQYGLLKTFIY